MGNDDVCRLCPCDLAGDRRCGEGGAGVAVDGESDRVRPRKRTIAAETSSMWAVPGLKKRGLLPVSSVRRASLVMISS